MWRITPGRGASALRNPLSILVFSLLVGSGLAACAGAGTPAPAYPAEPNAMTVVGAENFYADVLHQLGGSKLRIYSFLSNPNADPHQYESSAGNARAVADARVVVENGLGYDAFMEKLLGASPGTKRTVINVQRVVGAEEGANPHLWYDPAVMPRVSRAITDALAAADPHNAGVYRSKLDVFLGSLEPISAKVAEMKSRFEGTPVAFTEPVYGYMAQALGLEVRSPAAFMKAVEEGNDPPSSAIAEEQSLITGHQVKALLYNGQTETKVTARIKSLANANGVPVVGITETEPPGRTFQAWQLDELSAVAAALSGS
jgi:zinc/manganese transport system substrate-binding protein